jgi:hypothetical protein
MHYATLLACEESFGTERLDAATSQTAGKTAH